VGVGGIALSQQRVVLGNPVRLLVDRRLRGAARAPLLGRRVHSQQQIAQLAGPSLVVPLRQEGQVAHQRPDGCAPHQLCVQVR
jgi:hypothetical protein